MRELERKGKLTSSRGIRLDAETHFAVKAMARGASTSMSEVMRSLMVYALATANVMQLVNGAKS